MKAFGAFWLGLCMAVLPMTSAKAAPKTMPRTAIVLAFDPEWQALIPHVSHVRTRIDGGVKYLTGDIEGHPVVVTLCGISMVNAAMTTQRLIDRYTVKRLIVSGIAGGIDPTLRIGDITVPEHWSQPMETLTARQTPEGNTPPKWLWGMSAKPAYGTFMPRQVRIDDIDYDSFPADPDLLAIARRLSAPPEVNLVVGGEGVSAPSFIDNADYRQYLYTAFHARVADMETAAIAQVAFANKVPFIAFRSVSDLAGADPDANQMAHFMATAADHSAAAVVSFVKALP